jgi:hypothetical protein
MKEKMGEFSENISQGVSDFSDNAERNKYLKQRVAEARYENDKFLSAFIGKEVILTGNDYSLLRDVNTGLLFYKYRLKDDGMMTPSWQIIPVYNVEGAIMNYSELPDDVKATIIKREEIYHEALEEAYGGENEE